MVPLATTRHAARSRRRASETADQSRVRRFPTVSTTAVPSLASLSGVLPAFRRAIEVMWTAALGQHQASTGGLPSVRGVGTRFLPSHRVRRSLPITGAESQLPGGDQVKGGDEAVGSVVAFDRARDESWSCSVHASRRTSTGRQYAGAGDQSGMKVMMVSKSPASLLWARALSSWTTSRGAMTRNSVCAPSKSCSVRRGCRDRRVRRRCWGQRRAAGLQVAAGGGVGGCRFGLQMVFGDEPGALGQTVRVGADGVACAVVDAVAAHGEER